MNAKKRAALALAAAAPGAMALGVSEYFLRAAVDRQQPKSLQLLLQAMQGLKKGDDPYAGLEAGWERLRGLPHERVELTAPDGVKLVGHFFEAEGAKRALVAVHGWRSRWFRDFGASFDFYRAQGCSVLYIEQRGQGESGGGFIGFGLTERLDLPLWAAWLSARCGAETPLYLAGISMGAATVLMGADLEYPETLRGLMSDCGYTSVEGIWSHVAENLRLPYAPFRPLLRILFRKRTGVAIDAVDACEALRRCRLPVLLIHGGADAFVPPENAEAACAACGERGRLLIVPGAGHGLSYLVDQSGYESALLAFWRDCETG